MNRIRGYLKWVIAHLLRWQYQLSKAGADIHLGNYYEFGVYRGDTMITFYRVLKSFLRRAHQHNPETKLFAFDSRNQKDSGFILIL